MTKGRKFTFERETNGYFIYTTPLGAGKNGVIYLPKGLVKDLAPATFDSFVGSNDKTPDEIRCLRDENARLKARLVKIDQVLIEARRLT